MLRGDPERTRGAVADFRAGVDRPARAPDERNELHPAEMILDVLVLGDASHADQLLRPALHAHRDHETATDRKLVEQGLRHLGPAGGHHDRIKRGALPPTEGPVAGHDLDVVVPELGHAPSRSLGERPVALDRPDPAHDPAQHGGGVSRAGSDFQDPVVLAELQRLEHHRDDVGWDIVCPPSMGRGVSS